MKKSLFMFLLVFGLFACSTEEQAVKTAQDMQKKQEVQKKEEKTITTKTGLKYEDIVVGSGKEATVRHKVKVHYTGWLTNGKKFDSSYDRKKPFSFHLGAGQVIKGWDEGVVGMKVGGKRRLIIPPELGYGSRGAGGVIPPDATLIFVVELLDVS